jgi:hypothetical protein
LAGTDWEGPAYRIQLANYEPLDPTLPREAFLARIIHGAAFNGW